MKWSADQCRLELFARQPQVRLGLRRCCCSTTSPPWPCRCRIWRRRSASGRRRHPVERAAKAVLGTGDRPGCLRPAFHRGPLAGAERRRRPLLAGPRRRTRVGDPCPRLARVCTCLCRAPPFRQRPAAAAPSGCRSGRPPRRTLVDSRDRRACRGWRRCPMPGSDRHLLRNARLGGRKSCAHPRRPGWRVCRRWYHSKAGGNVRSLTISRPFRGQGALRFLPGRNSDLCNAFSYAGPAWRCPCPGRQRGLPMNFTGVSA
jgi:hypothetical protein